MKEHIEEMTKVLVDYTKKNHIMASHVILEDYAEQLYNAGYRKQSAAIDEFAERLKKRLYDKPSIFTQQRYIVNDEIDKLVEEMKGGAE